MGQQFTTRIGFGDSADDEAEWKIFLARIDEQRDLLIKDMTLRVGHEMLMKTRDYGRRKLHGSPNYPSSQRLLYPAGYSRSSILSETNDAPEIGISYQLREIASDGLPDIYAAYLYVQDAEGERRHVSYSIPVQSGQEAFDRFANAMKSPCAEEVSTVCGGDDFARVFGAAASPECLCELLKIPAPTTRDLGRLSDELSDALKSLLAVYEKWDGSDALNYLIDRSLRPWAVRNRQGEYLAGDQLARIDDFRKTFEPSKKRSGRPMQGGKSHLVARTLASLWKNCGLGEPELWNDSKFIRACTVVLPWHDIHKADIVQFMRSELAKKARSFSKGLVLID